MKKINKIINIALIFMLIGVFFGQELVYGAGGLSLRVPMQFNNLAQKEQIDAYEQLLAELEPSIIEKLMKMPTLIIFLLGLKPAYYAYKTGESGQEVIEAVVATTTFKKRFRAFPEDPSESYVLYNREAVRDVIIELNALMKDKTTVDRVVKNFEDLAGVELGGDEQKIKKSVSDLFSDQFPEEPEVFLWTIFDKTSLEAESVAGITSRDALARGFTLGVPFIDAVLYCVGIKRLLPAALSEKDLSDVRYLNGDSGNNVEYIIRSQEFIKRAQVWDKALESAYKLMVDYEEATTIVLQKIDQEASEQEDKLENIFLLALEPLKDGKVTIERLNRLFSVKEEQIFALLKEIKKNRVRRALINKDFSTYVQLEQNDSPDSALCNITASFLAVALKELGLSPNIVAIKDFNLEHYCVGLKTEEGFIAIDVASGQIIPDNVGHVAVGLLDEYIEEVKEKAFAKIMLVGNDAMDYISKILSLTAKFDEHRKTELLPIFESSKNINTNL